MSRLPERGRLGSEMGWQRAGGPARRVSNPSHVAAQGLSRMGPRGTEMGRRLRELHQRGEVREEEAPTA